MKRRDFITLLGGAAAAWPLTAIAQRSLDGRRVGVLAKAAVLRNAAEASGIGQYAVILAAAPSVDVEVRPIGVKDSGEIERAITAFVRASNSGLIVTASTLAGVHRKLIIGLAARHRLPAVYPFRYYATSGGLISYGPDTLEPPRR